MRGVMLLFSFRLCNFFMDVSLLCRYLLLSIMNNLYSAERFAGDETMLSPQSFFGAMAAPVLYNVDSPYKLMSRKLDDIDMDYFQRGEPLGNRLDGSLEMEIKTRILNDFKFYGEQLYENAESIKQQIIDDVRDLIFRYEDRATAFAHLSEAMERMHGFVRKQLCFVPIPMYSRKELKELYDEAKRVTLLERVTGGNGRDVIRYYHALIVHTVWACRMLTRRRAGQFLMQMVDRLSREFDMDSPMATFYNDEPTPFTAPDIPNDLLPLVDKLAHKTHNVWMDSFGENESERNGEDNRQPSLVSYERLTDEEKEHFRRMSAEMLKYIISQGYVIIKRREMSRL